MTLKTAVVFIPALLCDEQLYRQLIASLGDRISGHVMLSPKPTLAESVADILARAPAQFVLVGTSYGGNLALEIALAAPERVTRLWLMGCDPGAPQQGGRDLAHALETMPDAIIDRLAAVVVRAADTASAAVFRDMARRVGGAAGAMQARALSVREDRSARLNELTMPTLLTWGAEDGLVPPSVGEAMLQRLPNATLHILPACGHLPTLEQPEQAAALLAALID